ncbi:MAG: heme A synthase [Oligoflexia bacterium]|nr:heme A synthase [Oligoflexia bacterium]
MPAPAPAPASASRPVRTWLVIVFLMILLMTAIGGTTRLTGSGLSMVEWHPLMGALPPLSGAAWADVFDKYQATPQYLQVNDWMTLADFKRIFFWEYIHRLLGRSIGLVVFVPWIWFLVRRKLSRRLAWQTFGLLALGGSQGLLGWYMVESGLVDDPHVSHLRLAAHLLLAFVVAQAVAWVRLSLDPTTGDARPARPGTRLALAGLGVFVMIQSAWGAFMAGTRAGWFASTFPDVNGVYNPLALAGGDGGFHALVFDPGPIHATHRLLAWALVLLAAVVLAVGWRDGAPQLRGPLKLIAALLVLQVCLGAATVILHVPTAVAVAHQVTALLLLTCVTLALERARRGVRAL